MAERGKLAEMVDAEEARVEAELSAEESAAVEAEERHRLEQLDRKIAYHFQRFLELSGHEVPEGGMLCPTCHMGIVDVSPMQDAEVTRCDFCNGLGRTLTGSLVEGNDTRMCPRCKGAGHKQIGGVTPTEPQAVEMPQIPVIPYVHPTEAQAV